MGFALGGAIYEEVFESPYGPSYGPAVGIAQWLVLRQNLSRAGWWVLASTAGMALGLAGVNGVGWTVDEFVGFAVYGAITGGRWCGCCDSLFQKRKPKKTGPHSLTIFIL